MWESLLFSLNSTMPLFFVMLLGYALRRCGFLTDEFVAVGNKFVFHIALPVQLFRDLALTDLRASFDAGYVLFCSAVTAATILTIWGLARLLLREKHIVGEFVQACYRSSAAILGAAFIQNIYGTSGMSGLMILGSVPLYNIFAVLILTLESPAADRSADLSAKLRKSLRGILTNPILIGIALGFLWGMARLPIPTMADKTLASLAGLTSPLALLAIGAGFKGRAALGYLKPTVAATLIKLVVLPALFLPLAVRLGFTDQKLVALLVMLGSITTPASYVMARQMGHEGVLTGSVCVTTTVFSALTLTFWIFWARSLGYIL
ncbi:MAG: AEC family transporter [Faecalibacterium sp.]